MAKYRIVSKGNIVTIKSKLSFGEQINEREINIFEQQIFRGCFRPRQEGKKTIIYTAPDVVPLISYLKKGVDEETFFLLAAQTIEMTKKIEMNGLYVKEPGKCSLYISRSIAELRVEMFMRFLQIPYSMQADMAKSQSSF